MLRHHDLTYRVVTPLYLGNFAPRTHECDGSHHGANDKAYGAEVDALKEEAAQFTVQPIVDQWRWWFRALVGGLLDARKDPETLRELEWKYFGGIGSEDAGPLSFKAMVVPRPRELAVRDYTEDPQHKDRWASYLGYGLGADAPRIKLAPGATALGCMSSAPDTRPRSLKEHPRFAITPGEDLTIRVVCDTATSKILIPVIAVASNLGGLGARSRRGLGSVQLWRVDGGGHRVDGDLGGLADWARNAYDSKNAQDAESLDTFLKLTDPNLSDLITWVRQSLRHELESRHKLKVLAPSQKANLAEPDFPVVDPDWLEIYDASPKPPASRLHASADWHEALEAIRNQLRIDRQNHDAGPLPHRNRWALDHSKMGWRQRDSTGAYDPARTSGGKHPYWKGRDHDAAKDAAIGTTNSPAHNVMFGLPIPYTTPSGSGLVINAWRDDKQLRRPSPLSFRVWQDIAGSYRVRMILMKSHFVPNDVSVKAVAKNVSGDYKWSNAWTDLEGFIKGCGTRVPFK